MGYTIKDFVESNQFEGLKFINHAELDREITDAQIISMIDIENLAGGGQLLLTSLRVYDNLDKNTVIYHLEELNKKRISGFVVKRRNDTVHQKELFEIIYVFLTIFLYLLKCPQSLILSALRAFCFCGKPHISRSIFLYFRYQSWLKSW